MRFIWTDAGDDPSWDVGDRHEIDGYFWPLFDPLTTRENLINTQERGHDAGVYVAANWPQLAGKTPAEVAGIVNGEYRRLAVPHLRVQFNDERHEPELIAEGFERWRKVRPNVNTSWSCEGMQGGWMGPRVTPNVESSSFVKRILGCKIRVVPQGYWGAAGRIDGRFAEDQVLRDLTTRGFPEHVVSLFYDAADLPRDWYGFAFTMGRLS